MKEHEIDDRGLNADPDAGPAAPAATDGLCPECSGAGISPETGAPCPMCDGTGRAETHRVGGG